MMDINQALSETIQRNGIIKFVDIGPSSLNQGVLSVDKLDRFIREMKENTVLLDAARIIPMESFTKEINRISLRLKMEAVVRDQDGTILRTDQDPTFACNILNAQGLTTYTRMTMEALKDNIEKGNLFNTLISLFGDAGGEALERTFIYGDKSQKKPDIDTGYKAINGWIKKSKNKLFGKESKPGKDDRDFNPDQKNPSQDDYILTRMKDALDPKYLKKAVFFVSNRIANEYQRSLKNKDTDLGDQANLNNGQLTFEGHPVIRVYSLDEPLNDPTFFGPEALFFGDPANFVYGLWENVEIETVKDVHNRMWKFYLHLRSDCHFEDETKTICALPQVNKPEK